TSAFFDRIIEIDAANISVANKSMTNNDFDISKPPMYPNFSGIAGTRSFLVRNTAIMEGTPKTIVVLRLTKPCLYFGNTPTRLVVPTINNEYAVAKTGETPKK